MPPKEIIKKLQRIQNAATHLLMKAKLREGKILLGVLTLCLIG